MKGIFIFLIRCYQRCLSPLIPPCCRFEPTCSSYAIEAIRKKGILRGSLLAAWRILRCNPWCKGGYDPVERTTEDRGQTADVNHPHPRPSSSSSSSPLASEGETSSAGG